MGDVVRRHIDFLIHIIYPYSTCISSFLQQYPYFFAHLIFFPFLIIFFNWCSYIVESNTFIHVLAIHV